MNKEVEEAMKRLRDCVRNSDDEYATVIIQQAFSDMEGRNKRLQEHCGIWKDIADTNKSKLDKLKIKVKNYMQLNSPALLFKDKWDEKIELEKEIKQLL